MSNEAAQIAAYAEVGMARSALVNEALNLATTERATPEGHPERNAADKSFDLAVHRLLSAVAHALVISGRAENVPGMTEALAAAKKAIKESK